MRDSIGGRGTKNVRLYNDHHGFTLYLWSLIVRIKWDGRKSYFGNGSTWFVIGNWREDNEWDHDGYHNATEWRSYSPLYMHDNIDRIKSSEGTTDDRTE